MKQKAIDRVSSKAFGLAKNVTLDAIIERSIRNSTKTRSLQRAKRLGIGVMMISCSTNTGFKAREALSDDSKTFDLMGPLFLNFLRQR